MNRLDYCTYIRTFAMTCIILTHLVQQHPNIFVQMSAQCFSIGVQIFFCLSGFLLGHQGRITSIGQWYKKRLRRIYIPWILFVAILACIHLIKGNNILTWNWAKLLFGLQGTVVGVEGAGHTWFITCLLLCYLFTPLLSFCCSKFNSFGLGLFLLTLPLFLAILPLKWFSLLCPTCWYGIAYIIGQVYDEQWLTKRNGVIAFCIALCCIAIRFLVRLATDSVFLYEKLCVNYSMYLAAIGFMFFMAVLLKNREVRPFSKYICDISFEVYLYHYMLCVGPISIFSLHLPWCYSASLIILSVVGIATITHYLTNWPFEKALNK